MAKTFAKVLSATLAVTMLASVVPMTTASAATDKTITLLNRDGLTDTTARVGDSFELTANDSSLNDANQKNGQYVWTMSKDGYLEMGQAADKSLNKKKFTAKKIGMVEVTAKCKNSEDQGCNFVTVNMGLHPQSGRKNWNTGDKFRLYTLGDYDGTYTWSSNNTDVLTVSAPTSMVLTSTNIGEVEGKGQVGDHISYVDVTVKKAGSATVLVNAKKSGEETQYAAEIFNVRDAASSVTINGKDGNVAREINLDYQKVEGTNSDKTYFNELKAETNNGDWILWSTSDKEICNIIGYDDGTVWITPRKVGTVTLTASTYKGKKAECVVNVKQAATAVKIYRESGKLLLTDGSTSTGLQMTQNDKVNIFAEMTPSSSTDYIETWTSSSPSVATVAAESKGSNKAIVTAKGAGTATITAITNRGVSRVFSVNVSGGIPATGITLDKTSVTLDTRTAASIVITPTMTPAGTTDSIVWTSSDENVVKFLSRTNLGATIAAGTKPGTATITATTSSGKKATCVVTVIVPATSIKLSETSRAVFVGESTTLTTTLTPSISNDKITYSTNNSSVLSLTPSADGKSVTVKALAAGTATVTAKSTKGGATSSCNFTVTKKEEAKSITFVYPQMSVEKDKSATIEYKINPTEAQDYTNVTWKSSSPSVATVDSKGIVRGVAKGTTTITATTDNGKTATCTVTVTVPATGVKLDATSKTITARQGFTLKATMTPADTTDTVAWSTNNANVATVDTNGNVYGVAVGTAIITATTSSGKKVTCSVKVEASVANFIVDYQNGVTESRMNISGSNSTKTAVIKAKSGETLSGTYTWKVASGNSVTVAPSADTRSAKITATNNIGLSEVQVTDKNGNTASIFYSVKEVASSIKFVQPTFDIDLNQTGVLAVAMDKDDWITWVSSDNSVVEIDAVTGIIKAKKVAGGGNSGTATVTATTSNGVRATCTVFVRQPATGVKINDMKTPVSLSDIQTVTVASISLVRGESENINVIFNPQNSTDFVANWKSEDESICSVASTSSKNNKITITAHKPGTITLNAETNRGNHFVIQVAVAENYPASSLELGAEEVQLDLSDDKNNTFDLSATMLLSDDNQDKQTTDKITWTSDNTNVATIAESSDSGCKIEAKGAGVAHITATTTSGLAKTCTVKVVVPVTAITFKAGNINNATSGIVASGKTLTLTANVTPSNSKSQLTWTVADESIATISDATNTSCKITGVKGGTTQITCTPEKGASATFTVQVLKSASAVTINAPKTTLYVGDTSKLTAELTPSDAQDSVAWSSSNAKIVKVDEVGNITAVADGTATITAQCKIGTTNTVKSTITINVVKPVTAITFKVGTANNVTSGVVASGKTFQLTAAVTPSTSKDQLTWTVEDESIATISNATDKGCKVTGVNGGTTKITCTAESGYSIGFTVQVLKSASAVTIDAPKTTLYVGGTSKLTAKLTPSDAQDSVAWSSSNANVVKVDEAGNITAVAAGQATITAQCKINSENTVKSTVTIKVISPATSIAINKTTAEILKGSQTTFSVTLSAGSKDSVTWTSSNTKVATVENNPNNSLTATVKGVAAGTATITATTGSGKKVTADVKVIENATSIKLNKTSVTIDKNSKLTLVATQTPSTASEAVTWSTSNQNIATVSSNGVVTAKNVSGEVIITARTKTSNKTATCKILVKPSKITGFKVKASDAKSVTLSWTKSSEVQGYYVYRKVGGVPKLVTTITNAATTTYKINNLSSATTYSFAVVGYKKSGNTTLMSSYSWVNATTRLAAVSGFKVASQSTSAIKLTWSKMSGATGYEVYRQSGNKWVKVATVKSNSYTNSKLKVGTAYTYRIRAYKTVGKTNIYSYAWTTLKTATRLSAVPGFKAASQSTSAIKLAWGKVSGASGYEIYRQSGSKWVKVAAGKSTTYTNKKLKAGTAYTYRIRAYKTVGNTKVYSSSWKTLKTATKTATPSLTVKGASKSVKISWKRVSGASGYEVFMSTSKNGKYKKIATLSSSKSSYTKTRLKKGSSCYIRVRTYKTVGGKKIYSGYQTKGVKVR